MRYVSNSKDFIHLTGPERSESMYRLGGGAVHAPPIKGLRE